MLYDVVSEIKQLITKKEPIYAQNCEKFTPPPLYVF